MRFRFFPLAAVVTAALIPLSVARAQSPPRPNILWITCEDISPDLGCYGDAYAHTPNLDRLAKQGTRFTRAFTVYGVCAPSRSCIITGMYPTSIGTHHMRCKGVPPHFVHCFTEYLRALGYYCCNRSKTDYNFDNPVTAWDDSSPKAHWRNRPRKDQPFFCVMNLLTTHESKIRAPAKEFAKLTARLKSGERHDPGKAQLPPYYPDTPVVRRDWANYYDLITAMDYQVGEILRQLEEDDLLNSTIVFFYSDHGRGLPRAKRWVYDSGTHIPLLIRWPGRLPPGSVNEELVSEIDFAPTVLSLAGARLPAYLQGRIFLGPQKQTEPKYLFMARDRMDETYDRIRSVRSKQYRYVRNFEPKLPYAQKIDYMDLMPTMKEWRRLHALGQLKGPQTIFFLPEKPEEELYDLTKDPHEIHNLAGSPAHQAILKDMRQALDRWIVDTNDLGRIPEAKLWDLMRPGGQWATTQPPVLLPAGGTFGGPVEIKVHCPTLGASLAWTTDEGKAAYWQLYAEPIVLTRNATLRVKACRLGYKDSPEVTATFTLPAGGK
jgi:uncharacterized sulfatase